MARMPEIRGNNPSSSDYGAAGESITQSECRIRVIRVIRGAPPVIRVHLCGFVVKRLQAPLAPPYAAAGTRETRECLQ